MTPKPSVLLLVAVAFAVTSLAPARAANTPSRYSQEHQVAARLHHGEKRRVAIASYRDILGKGPRDSFATGLPYVEDYQKLAKVTVDGGSLMTDGDGDLNHDGYNESRGCFVIRAEKQILTVVLDARSRPCFHPAIRIESWTGSMTPQITLDGQPAKSGVDATVPTNGSSVIVQLLSRIEDRKISIVVQ